eukprot:6686250-Lingulodinium_polyedra.AAC.1
MKAAKTACGEIFLAESARRGGCVGKNAAVGQVHVRVMFASTARLRLRRSLRRRAHCKALPDARRLGHAFKH